MQTVLLTLKLTSHLFPQLLIIGKSSFCVIIYWTLIWNHWNLILNMQGIFLENMISWPASQCKRVVIGIIEFMSKHQCLDYWWIKGILALLTNLTICWKIKPKYFLIIISTISMNYYQWITIIAASMLLSLNRVVSFKRLSQSLLRNQFISTLIASWDQRGALTTKLRSVVQ